MTTYRYKFCVQEENEKAITDLFYTIREELYLPDRETCEQITALCFAHGGVFGAFDRDLLVGTMGFFYGEPHCEFTNKETVFMYAAGILPQYRLTRVFLGVLLNVLDAFDAQGIQHIKLQADANNPYTLRLYGRFAQPIEHSRSLRGKETITFASTIPEALQRVERWR